MKNILLFLFTLLPFIGINAQSNSPNFKEIYDFDVGDIFLYQSSGYNNKTAYTKYEITGKTIKGDTLIYERLVSKTETYSYTDTITYIDSVEHYLNAYQSDTVPIIAYGDTVCSVVFIGGINDPATNKRMYKMFSSTNYAYINGACDTTNWLDPNVDGEINLIFEQGIGCSGKSKNVFELGKSTYLVGYRKGRDTIGILSGITLGSFEKEEYKLNVYPNPFNERLFIELPHQVFPVSYHFINQQGTCVRSIVNTHETEILTSGLPVGFYLLLVTDNTGNKRFVKIIK